MYHFRIKNDKKPDGTKIASVAHVEYINREGAYKDADEQEIVKKIVGANFITSRKKKDAYNGQYALFYQTEKFGAIANTPNGIAVTDNPTDTTLAIALMIAYDTMEQQPLIIRGRKNFRNKILDVAAKSNLAVSFDNKKMEEEFQRRKEALALERKNFIEQGGKYVSPSKSAKPHPQFTTGRKIGDVTQTGLRLPTLSERAMARPKSERPNLLLQNYESHQLDEQRTGLHPNVRRDLGREQRELAEKSAKIILDRIAENSKQVFAASHAQYINRESYFAKRGGVVFTDNHLPQWAQGSPKNFFAAADRYEGKRNCRYMEIEFALPNEFTTTEQYRQIIDAFIQKHLSNHYYAYAIHEKTGLMSDNERHPHVHIMFSERLIDDVEREHERTPENFFAYPLRRKKNAPPPTTNEKRQHGAPKDRRWTQRRNLWQIREDFCKIQNEILAKNGFSVRVDHRTLKEQKNEAINSGDEFQAKIFDRFAELNLGVITPEFSSSSLVRKTMQARTARRKFQSAAYAIDKIKREIEELEAKDEAQIALMAARKLLDTDEVYFQRRTSKTIKEKWLKLKAAIKEVNVCKQRLLTADEAEEKATLEYLTADEKKLWLAYKNTANEKANLEKFYQTLKKPINGYEDALEAYEQVIASSHKQIRNLAKKIADAEPTINAIQKKISTPGCRKSIERAAHNRLQANAADRKNFYDANRRLATATDELRQAVFHEELNIDIQGFLSSREVYSILKRRHTALQEEQEDLFKQYKILEKKVISTNRAMAMAENIYSQGAWKAYREAEQKYKKQIKNIGKKRTLAAISGNFNTEIIKIQYEESKLAVRRKKLDDTFNKLTELCNTPEAKSKIRIIAAGILRKNAKIAAQYREVDKQRKICREQTAIVKEKMNNVYRRLYGEHAKTQYKLAQYPTNTKSQKEQKITPYLCAAIIADAIGGNPEAVQLVATSDGSSLAMPKDWNLMTELEKDEERMQALQQLI